MIVSRPIQHLGFLASTLVPCALFGGALNPVGIFDDAIDIGQPAAAGSTVFDGTTYTMRGSGIDIGDSGDQLQFAFKAVTGDFTATIHITRRDRTPAGSGTLGRHGLMARWNAGSSSKYSFVGTLLPTADAPLGGHLPIYQYRLQDQVNAGNRIDYVAYDGTFPTEGREPTWMRLIRMGNCLYGYLAEDADHDGSPDRWCLIGSDSSPYLPDTLLVGVALQAQAGPNHGNLGTIAFNNVSIDPILPAVLLDCQPSALFISSDFSPSDPQVANGEVKPVVRSGAFTPRILGERLRLTQDGVFSSSTAVWFDVPGAEALTQNGFQAEFDAILTKPGLPGDVNPADGMTFAVVQDGSSILAPQGVPDLGGDGGGALGYGGHRTDQQALSTIRDRTACHPSFAVEMDNWTGCGGDPCNDPFGDGSPEADGRYHVGLDLNGEISSFQTNEDHGVSSGLLGDIFSLVGIHVRVRYTPDGQITVWVLGNGYAENEYEVLSARIPALTGPVLLGFTGGTGAATCTAEVDNFVVTTLTCTPAATNGFAELAIDLANITAGGDGIHGSPVQGVGIDPRNGHFVTSYLGDYVFDSQPEGDGLNPSPTDSPYIDSVFFIDNAEGSNYDRPITLSGARYYFEVADRDGYGFNYILKDRNGGVSRLDPDTKITIGPFTGFTSAVGIHSSMGITYNLDALRARYGASQVQCFSTVWGMDPCVGAGGDVNLYAILSRIPGDDTLNVLSVRTFHATQGSWDIIEMPIPSAASYLTLATGSNGGLFCDHGTFGRAVITALPCPQFSSFSWLWSVTPSLVSTLGGQQLAFSGELLNPNEHILVGGKFLTNEAYPDAETATGISPPLLPGFYDATIANSDFNVTFRLRNAVEAAPPLGLTFVDPGTVSRDGTTQVNIHGANFRSPAVVTVGDGGNVVGPLLNQIVVSESLITGVAPPLSVDQANGPRAITVSDTRGSTILPNGVTYTDPPPVTIQSVDPSLVSTLGGTTVTFTGTNLDASFTLRLGGIDLTNQVFIDSSHMTGATPQLPAGFQTAELINANAVVVSTLVNAVEAAPPVTLTSVTPRDVFRDGTTAVDVRGTNFRSATEVSIGDHALASPELLSANLIRGFAPALDPGEPGGFQSVTAGDSRGQATLESAVKYISRPVVLLASVSPSQVSILGGTIVTFNGQNFLAGVVARIDGIELTDQVVLDLQRIRGVTPPLPAGFHRAEIASDNGVVFVTLQNAVEAITPVPGPQEIETSLAEGSARFSWFNPVKYKEVLVLNDAGGILARLSGDTKNFKMDLNAGEDKIHLNFQGIAAIDNRSSLISDAIAKILQCSRPPPLMGNPVPGKLVFSVYGGSPDSPPPRCTPAGGGGAVADDGTERGHAGGVLQAIGSLGYVVSAKDRFFLNLPSSLTNTLSTGFTLDQDADKLEIAGFYQKIATVFGLELRGKLRHVYPTDGFQDELTFPDLTLGKDKDWNPILYFRATGDVINPGSSPCPGGLRIPKGDYLLDIYAVNGDNNTPYYVFTDDGRDNELLIQGSTCPPYPLVTVKDLTGYSTLPLITSITAEPLADLGSLGITVRYTAHGYWLDGNTPPKKHSIDPADTVGADKYIANDFEYTWKVHDKEDPFPPTSSSNSIIKGVRDWGCWEVEIIAKDKRCGFSRTYTYEVPLVPANVTCNNPYNSYIFPTPDPSSIYGVVGLKNPTPGHGSFTSVRPAEFRVLVVPRCYCDKTAPCPAPQFGDFELELADSPPVGPEKVYFKIPNDLAHIKDLCPNTVVGKPKYFEVIIDDIGALPLMPGTDGTFRNVYLKARTLKVRNADMSVTPVSDTFRSVGGPLHLTNAPKSLSKSYWSGSYDKKSLIYHFITNSSPESNEHFNVGKSNAIPLPLPGIDIKVPSFDNSMNSGLTSKFKLQGPVWGAEDATGTTSGEALGNKLDGAPLSVKASKGAALRAGDGAGGIDLPTYEWCTHAKILDNHLKQTLFESILFTGTIGPVPVTVWASISLSLDITMDALVRVFVSPFGVLGGGHLVESDFYLLSKLSIAIPCSIRADILMGIASIAATLKPQADINLDAHIGIEDLSSFAGLDIGAYFSLYFEVKACLNVLFTDICYSSGEIPVIDHKTIIHKPIGDVPFCVKDSVSACTGYGKYCTPTGGGGEADAGGLDGQGAFILSTYTSTSAPVSVTSPNGLTTIDSWISPDGSAKVFVNGNPTEIPGGDQGLGAFHDPSACFLSNTKVLIAWTKSFGDEAGVTLPLPTDTNDVRYLPDHNKITAQDEIVISPFDKPSAFWAAHGSMRIADPVSEVPAIADRRADGRPSIAADLPREQAIVAWVRYETPDFLKKIDGETTRIYVKQLDGSFLAVDAPTVRPQLDSTAIYTRRIGFTGPVGASRKISPPGINIEPVIAFSPSGEVAYCLWVNDPTHKDLVKTNLGRHILYSVYTRGGPDPDSWSVPVDLFPSPDDYPGLLEPSMTLKADGKGLAVFTALDKGASELDTGLTGGSRFVYTCRLEGGVFGPPVRIHGKCQKREYGHWAYVFYPDPVLIDPFTRFRIPEPDWVVVWQETGEIGAREGSGNVKASVLGVGMQEFTAPVSLTKDQNIHSNVAASLAGGTLHTINLNLGSARLGLGGGVGGGGVVDFIPDYETLDVELKPDLLIASCTLSDPFSAPGSTVIATVEVENVGLAGSLYDNAGQSVVFLQAVFIDEKGVGRAANAAPVSVPVLQPGEKQRLTLTLEMPHDPVRLRVELNPNPLDTDSLNDTRECFFGAPMPHNLVCETMVAPDEDSRLVMHLEWTNPAIYDEVRVYRDGGAIAAITGTSESYVDIDATAGTHEYAVRGVIGVSKSVRAICTPDVAPPTGGRFHRGDADGNGSLQLTDAVRILNVLFLGVGSIACNDAADADDNGTIQLTDAVRILNVLFLGVGAIPPPATPGSGDCGVDPTPDAGGTDLGCEAYDKC